MAIISTLAWLGILLFNIPLMGQILELWFSAGNTVNVPLMGKISTLPLIMAILFSFARASAGVFVVEEINKQRWLAARGLVSLLSLIVVFETLGAGYRGWILAEEQERIISTVISGTLGFVIPIMEIITGQYSLREFFPQAAPVGWSKFKALIIWLASSIVRTLFAFHRVDEIEDSPPVVPPNERARLRKENKVRRKVNQLDNDVTFLDNDVNSLKDEGGNLTSDFIKRCGGLYNSEGTNVTQFIGNTTNLPDTTVEINVFDRQFKENYRDRKRDCKNFLHQVKGIAREYNKKLKSLRKKGRSIKRNIQSLTEKRTKLNAEVTRIMLINGPNPDLDNMAASLDNMAVSLDTMASLMNTIISDLDEIYRNRTIQSTQDDYLSRGRDLLTRLDGHRESILQQIRQYRLRQFLSFWRRVQGPLGIISFWVGCGFIIIWLVLHFLLFEIISPWWLIIGIGSLILGLVFLSLTPQAQKN